jgi:glyoxylase-like metal-dependent hydrolase (beta-lactamase superfamily II)
MRRLFKTLLVLVIIAIAGYYPLVLHSPEPAKTPYVIDIAKIRELSTRLPGPLPYEIRVEKVAELEFAEAMVMAGEPWQGTPIPIYSYKLVVPGSSIIVDSAVSSTDGVPGFMVTSFDPVAYERMNKAMEGASQIVITHEHFDHIAGILDHPNLKQILPAVQLTKEQLKHTDRMLPASLPEDVFDDYQALEYEGLHALAPGVVLIEAPGHTPGSQMVYVRLSDGREVLLLGDVAWQNRNIEAVKERPLFMTAMIRENRRQVIEQFQALHELAKQAPEIKQVPGHDGAVVKHLVETGYLNQGF